MDLHNHKHFVVLLLVTALILPLCVFPAGAQSDYPSRFDLRDQDLVSRVKDQSPWGSCWAYGVTAAAEISILSQLRELGPDYAEYYADPNNLDLSELQPAWFSYTKLPDYGQDDPHSQAGEGTEYPNALWLDNGGHTLMVDNSYADGIGPIPEALAPYKAWKGEIDDDDDFMDDDDFWGVDGSGYFYLSYYDHSANGPQSFIFDILSEDSDTESLFRVIDQYDLFNGSYYSYPASDYGAEEISVANVFTADYDQYLRSVSLNTPVPDQEVSLSIYKLDPEWESPVDGDLVYSTDFVFPYAGWHKNDLEEGIELSAGDEFSLVMTTDVVAIEELYEDPEEDASEDKDFYEGTIIVNPRESFFLLSEENSWEDWIDISAALNGNDEDSSVTMYYDNPGLKAYSEPIQNLTARLEGYISDQGWTEGSEMYFRVVVGNPYGAHLGPILIKSALSGLADDIYMEIVPEEGTVEANYIYYLTENDVEDGTVTEFVTVEALGAPHLVGQTLRLSVFD